MFFLIDKPAGLSSFAAINSFKYEHHYKKVGHSGTLDPMATGLLLVATDEDTSLLQYISVTNKTYFVEIRLGVTSETYDTTGNLLPTGISIPGTSTVLRKIANLRYQSSHRPPVFSAKKIAGQRAYKLAREGTLTEALAPTQITIFSVISPREISPDTYTFTIEVSAGTYIRSLVHELGQDLKCGAVMSELRRTKIGHLDLSLVGMPLIFANLTNLPLLELGREVSWAQLRLLINGIKIPLALPDGVYGLLYETAPYGIIEVSQGIAKSKRLLGDRLHKIEELWKL